MAKNSAGDTVVSSGVTLGAVLAIVLSYDTNHSSGWAILHGLCSWLYCIYHWITY